jgi:hypothetical protein
MGVRPKSKRVKMMKDKRAQELRKQQGGEKRMKVAKERAKMEQKAKKARQEAIRRKIAKANRKQRRPLKGIQIPLIRDRKGKDESLTGRIREVTCDDQMIKGCKQEVTPLVHSHIFLIVLFHVDQQLLSNLPSCNHRCVACSSW